MLKKYIIISVFSISYFINASEQSNGTFSIVLRTKEHVNQFIDKANQIESFPGENPKISNWAVNNPVYKFELRYEVKLGCSDKEIESTIAEIMGHSGLGLAYLGYVWDIDRPSNS